MIEKDFMVRGMREPLSLVNRIDQEWKETLSKNYTGVKNDT